MTKATKNQFQTAISEIADAFETFTRYGRDKKCYRIKDAAPEWLRDHAFMRGIHEALDDRLPDDWVYETTASVASTLQDYARETPRLARESLEGIVDGLVDVYNHDRLEWIASHLGNVALVDEACEERCFDAHDIVARIGLGQYMAIERIGQAVIDAAEAEADSRDGSDADNEAS